MKIIVTYCLMLVCGWGYSQEFSEDLMRGYSLLESYKQLKVSMHIEMETTDGLPTQKHDAMVIRSPKGLYSHFFGFVQIITSRNKIVLDASSKSVTVSKIEKKQFLELTNNAISYNLDSLLGGMDTIRYLGKVEKGRVYEIYLNTFIERAKIWIDASTGTVTRMVYYYDTNAGTGLSQVAISFKYLDKLTNDEHELVNEKKYVKSSGKRMLLSKELLENGYQLKVLN